MARRYILAFHENWHLPPRLRLLAHSFGARMSDPAGNLAASAVLGTGTATALGNKQEHDDLSVWLASNLKPAYGDHGGEGEGPGAIGMCVHVFRVYAYYVQVLLGYANDVSAPQVVFCPRSQICSLRGASSPRTRLLRWLELSPSYRRRWRMLCAVLAMNTLMLPPWPLSLRPTWADKPQVRRPFSRSRRSSDRLPNA